MNADKLRELAERGIKSQHERSPGWREVHTLRLEADKATLSRAWDIDDGDMNGEEGECVAEVERTILENVLRQAALEGSVDTTLTSRNRWTRAVRYSESPSTSRKQSIDPYDGRVRLLMAKSADGTIDLTVLPMGSGQGVPWWLDEQPSKLGMPDGISAAPYPRYKDKSS